MTSEGRSIAPLIDRVIVGLRCNVERLATDAGLTGNALYGWRAGRFAADPESLRALADALERRAKAMEKLAGELRAAAEDA